MFTSFFTRGQISRTLFICLAGSIIGTIYILLNHFLTWNLDHSLPFYFMGAVFLLVGWMGGNRISNSYRRQDKNLTGPLPPEIIDKKMLFRSPLVVSSLFMFLAAICLEFIVRVIM